MRQNKHTGHQKIKEIVYFLLAAALCSSVSKKNPLLPWKCQSVLLPHFFWHSIERAHKRASLYRQYVKFVPLLWTGLCLSPSSGTGFISQPLLEWPCRQISCQRGHTQCGNIGCNECLIKDYKGWVVFFFLSLLKIFFNLSLFRC